MNLWQIRHIPNSSRNLVKLTLVCSLGLMVITWWGFSTRPVLGQGTTNQESAKPAGPDPTAAATAATEFMKQVRQTLHDRSSVKADLEQTVTVGNQQFQATGQYVSSGQKLRLEYTINPGQGISGSLLEVCDGKELWNLVTILESKRVTHRDVQQIKAAISQSRTVTDAVLTAELGMGGLSGLIASLERTMNFEAMKDEGGDDSANVIVQGRWKPEFQNRWPKGKDDALPSFIPDFVRITVDRQTKFPVRIVYVKRVVEKEKKVYRPLVSLKFSNIEFDKPIGDQEFTFEPGEGVIPQDITRQYLDSIKQSEESAGATGAGATK